MGRPGGWELRVGAAAPEALADWGSGGTGRTDVRKDVRTGRTEILFCT